MTDLRKKRASNPDDQNNADEAKAFNKLIKTDKE